MCVLFINPDKGQRSKEKKKKPLNDWIVQQRNLCQDCFGTGWPHRNVSLSWQFRTTHVIPSSLIKNAKVDAHHLALFSSLAGANVAVVAVVVLVSYFLKFRGVEGDTTKFQVLWKRGSAASFRLSRTRSYFPFQLTPASHVTIPIW